MGEGEFAGQVVLPTDGEDGVVGEGEGYDGKGFESLIVEVQASEVQANQMGGGAGKSKGLLKREG